MSDKPITEATYNGTIIRRGIPLLVENEGTVRPGDGTRSLVKWRVRMDSMPESAYYWGEPSQPCPFEKGKPCWYTEVKKSYGQHIMPYVAKAVDDKDRRITKLACLNTANTFIANGGGPTTIENLTSIAEALLAWVEK